MKLLRYITLNTLFAVALYFGIVEGVVGAANIVKFFTVAMFIFGVLGLIVVSIVPNLEPKNIRSVPVWVDLVYDFAVVGLFASFGWFGYATMYLISTVCGQLVAEIFKEKETNENV